MIDDLLFFLCVAGPVIFGFFVQSLTGAGGGMISIPIVGLMIEPQEAVAYVCLFQCCMSVMLIPLWREVLWSEVIKAIPTIMIFAILGAFTLTFVEPSVVRIILSFYIWTELLQQIRGQTSATLLPNNLLLPIGAFVNGMLGVGGPPIILWIQSKNVSVQTFRATMFGLYLFTNFIRIPVFITSEVLTMEIFILFLWTLPFFILALYLGHLFSHRVSKDRFTVYIRLILGCSATSLLIKAFL